MSLVVMKFGGTSVADKERLLNVARIIADSYDQGNDLVVVVSAQGDTTDRLIEKAKEVNPKPSKRETDMLMSTGEQVSAALLAMTLDAMGYHAISLTGFQAGFYTNSNHTSARITGLEPTRIEMELNNKNIVIVTGFQGIDKNDNITTLGRGGSDTSAVAIAARMHADICKIYTDVDGVYTADPHQVENAIKLDEICFEEMEELSSQGARVLLNRAVELAQKYNVTLEVLSSMTGHPGTIIKEVADMEGMLIKGVTKNADIVSISVVGVEDKPGVAYKLFSLLGKSSINVDIILQSVSRDQTRDIVFTVASDDEEEVLDIIRGQTVFEYKELAVDREVAKVSTVGAGILSHSGIAMRIFGALYDAGININMITTSEIKISVIINSKDADRAVTAIHDEFFRK